jgi:vacuolar-type H+-ATPase subunit H
MRRVTTASTEPGGADPEDGKGAATFTLSPLVAQGLAAAAGTLSDRAVKAEVELDPTRCKWVYRDGTQCGRKLPSKEPGKQGNSIDYCQQRHEPGHEGEGKGLHNASNWWAEKARRAKGIGVPAQPDANFDVASAPRPVTGGITWLSEQLSDTDAEVRAHLEALDKLRDRYAGLLDVVPQLADPDAARAEVSDREREFRTKLSTATEVANEAKRLQTAAERERDKAIREKDQAEQATFAIADESLAEQKKAEEATQALEKLQAETAEKIRAANTAVKTAKDDADERVQQIQAQADTAIADAKNSAAEARSDADRRVEGANTERDRLVAEARTQAERDVDAAEKRATEAIREAKERTDREIEAMRQTIEAKVTQAATEVQLAESKEAAALAREEAARVTAEANLARAVNAENNARRDATEHALELARLEERHERRISELYELLGWDENGEPVSDDGPSGEGRQ